MLCMCMCDCAVVQKLTPGTITTVLIRPHVLQRFNLFSHRELSVAQSCPWCWQSPAECQTESTGRLQSACHSKNIQVGSIQRNNSHSIYYIIHKNKKQTQNNHRHTLTQEPQHDKPWPQKQRCSVTGTTCAFVTVQVVFIAALLLLSFTCCVFLSFHVTFIPTQMCQYWWKILRLVLFFNTTTLQFLVPILLAQHYYKHHHYKAICSCLCANMYLIDSLLTGFTS